MKRLTLIMVSVVMIFSLFLVACSGNQNENKEGANNQGNNQASEQENNQNDRQEKVTISAFFAAGQFQKGNYGYTKILEDFMKKNPNITVEITAAHGKQWADTFLALASTNDLPDIIQPPGEMTFDQLVGNEWVQPLSGLVSDEFLQSYAEGTFKEGINQIDGKVYATPRTHGKVGRVLVYNKDIMVDAGLDPEQPPQTWDELYEMSKQIKAETGVYGMAFPFKTWHGWGDIITLGASLQPTLSTVQGDDGFDYQQGSYDFDSPAVTEALEFVMKMNDEGLVHPDSITSSLLDYQGILATKQAAFGLNREWVVRTNALKFDVQDYGVAAVPVHEEGEEHHQMASSAQATFYISSTTKQAEAAAKLIEYLGSIDYSTGMLQEDLLLPPAPSLLEDPSNFTNENLKNMAQVYKETIVERPNPAVNPGAIQAKLFEASLSKPKPDWWEAMQGIYLGKFEMSKLTEVNEAYNKRFAEAIEKAKADGADVSKQMFAFPDFDGKSDYTK